MDKFSTLIKREIWEHKSSIFYAPLVVFSLFTVFSVLGFVSISVDDLHIKTPDGVQLKQSFSALIQLFASLNPEHLKIAVQGTLLAFASPFNAIMLIVLALYTFSALYDERKDRSILFWKSMPVDDRVTVLAKLFIAMVVIPLSFMVFTVLTQVGWMVIASVISWFNDVDAIRVIWQPADIFMLSLNEVSSYFINSLWAFPLVAWGLLASSMARRAPFLYAFIPVIIILIIETSLFHSYYFADWLKERLLGTLLYSGVAEDQSIVFIESFEQMSLTNISMTFAKLYHPQMWIGLVIGAIFIAVAMKLRQLNDDVY